MKKTLNPIFRKNESEFHRISTWLSFLHDESTESTQMIATTCCESSGAKTLIGMTDDNSTCAKTVTVIGVVGDVRGLNLATAPSCTAHKRADLCAISTERDEPGAARARKRSKERAPTINS